MYDPIIESSRHWKILQTREQVTGAELAERLEVDIHTIQRYIVRLQDLSIPVECGVAYRLWEKKTTPKRYRLKVERFVLRIPGNSIIGSRSS